MEGIDEQSTGGEQLVVSREDRQRTRNRLAQRRHRERKRFADSRDGEHRRNQSSSSTTTRAENHEVSSNSTLPTPPPHHALPALSLPGPHFGFMPLPSPSAWGSRTDLHIPGTQKAQPVGAEFMHMIEGDYWSQTYSPAHELWDPIGSNTMAAIQAQAAPPPVHLVSPHGSHGSHSNSHSRARTGRSRSSSDGDSMSSSSSVPRQKQASTKVHRAFSSTTPVSTSSHSNSRKRRDSTARCEETDDEGLEARLERVLHIVEDNGFDSIDSMTSTYYTSDLLEDSFLRPMQSTSRTRRLRSLLSDLQSSYKSWTEREKSAYAEEIVRSAEGICSDELGALYGSSRAPPSTTSPVRRRASFTVRERERERDLEDQQSASLQAKRSEIARRIREVLSSSDIGEFLQKDQAALQNAVPETWSMMIELARRAGLQPHERVMVACINVYLLTDHHSS